MLDQANLSASVYGFIAGVRRCDHKKNIFNC